MIILAWPLRHIDDKSSSIVQEGMSFFVIDESERYGVYVATYSLVIADINRSIKPLPDYVASL